MTATRTLRLALGALGVLVLAYGVRGLLTERLIRDPAAVGEWLIGGLIGHDALLAPIVYVMGAIAYRFTSTRWRGRLAAFLLIGGSLFLISIPALFRQGLNPNPTVLPLDYTRNIGVLLAVLVAVIAVYGGIADRRRRSVAVRRALTAASAESAAVAAEPDESPDEEHRVPAAAHGGPDEDDAVLTAPDEPGGADEDGEREEVRDT